MDNSGPKDQAQQLIEAAKSGDAEALHQLFVLLQPELKRIAARLMSSQRHFTKYNRTGSGLVHELLMQMRQGGSRGLPETVEDSAEMLGLAAFRMSRILADNARNRNAQKRHHERAPIEAAEFAGFNIGTSQEPMMLNHIDVNRAFSKLAQQYPTHAKLLELSVTTGMNIEETAALLGVSRSKAVRDKRFALAYLRSELS